MGMPSRRNNNVEALHAEARAGGGELVQPLPERRVGRLARAIADQRARHEEGGARAPLTHAVGLPRPAHNRAPLCWAHHLSRARLGE
jgi:hypothetical protein